MTTTLTKPAKDKALRLKYVLDGTFRANPEYQLIALDQLPADQRELFAALNDSPDNYGVLMPRGASALPLKSACRDTARLFLALQEPCRLPAFATTGPSEDTNQGIAQLVLDGILQLSHGGQMCSGPAAFEAICFASDHAEPTSGIAKVSHEALLYAQSLPFTEAGMLSARLYGYGRLPATGSWKRRFPNEEAVSRALSVEPGGKNHLRLAARWKSLPPDPDNNGWLFWHSRTASTTEPLAAYKLYLSPHPEYLAPAFDAMVPALEASHANAFKVGKDLNGVLRSDKMIAYFSRLEHLQAAADRILETLAGCPAQGVPFTCQITTPLISWGSDPVAEVGVPPWLARQSWRLWITNRLAVSLIAARQQPNAQGREPWQFALDRLRLEGVNTDTWSPLHNHSAHKEN